MNKTETDSSLLSLLTPLTKKVIMLFLFMMFFLSQAFAQNIAEPFELTYSITGSGVKEKKAVIRSGFAEIFHLKDGTQMLYMVFYPYKVEPGKWYTILQKRKTDPENFFIIRIVGKTSGEIQTGTFHAPDYQPEIETSAGIATYRGSEGRINITKMEKIPGGIVEGEFIYENESMSLKGKFQAVFIAFQ